jgi:hypothetical protein
MYFIAHELMYGTPDCTSSQIHKLFITICIDGSVDQKHEAGEVMYFPIQDSWEVDSCEDESEEEYSFSYSNSSNDQDDEDSIEIHGPTGAGPSGATTNPSPLQDADVEESLNHRWGRQRKRSVKTAAG